MPKVIKNLANNLNESGVFYISFKYGGKEYIKDDRYFNCYNEESFRELISNTQTLKIEDMKITGDVREGREDEKWLNVICIKA